MPSTSVPPCHRSIVPSADPKSRSMVQRKRKAAEEPSAAAEEPSAAAEEPSAAAEEPSAATAEDAVDTSPADWDDVVLEFRSGGSRTACTTLLRIASPVFNGMFKSGMSEAQRKVVQVDVATKEESWLTS